MLRADSDEKLTFYYQGKRDVHIMGVVEKTLQERGHDLVGVYNEFLIDVYLMLDKKRSKFVAIDWDNTISADQGYFRRLIRYLQRAGYEPFVCSLRAPDRDNIKEICEVLDEAAIPIYLTDGKPKRKYMRKLGVKVHLWIDDFYPGVCGDSCKMLIRNAIK